MYLIVLERKEISRQGLFIGTFTLQQMLNSKFKRTITELSRDRCDKNVSVIRFDATLLEDHLYEK